MGYAVSTIYGEGQKFASSIDQGSMYMEVSYTNPLKFDPTLTITEPRSGAIVQPTVTNYPQVPNSYFMGRFDGFWVHRIYRDGKLVTTIQGVDQDLFIPMQYDRVESVSYTTMCEMSDCGHERGHPHVPGPSSGLLFAMAVVCLVGRKRI
jgi:hypothetical protein